MARQQLSSPFQSFLAGRDARQAHDYGQTRNKLAEIELADAPAQMQRRNALADIEMQGAQVGLQSAQQQLSADQAKFAYAKLKQAQDSGNPKAFIMQQIPELAAKLQQQGIDLNSMDDQSVMQLTDNLARKYAGDAGMAPAAPEQMTPYQQAQIALERDKMNAPKTMSPYEQARINLERQKLSQPQTKDAGPLVQVVGSDGNPVYATRDAAVGKPAYVAPTANSQNSNTQKKLGDAKDVQDIIALARPMIEEATNSYLGAGLDVAARAFGKSTEGSRAISSLKSLQAALMLKMPRMEGPQSNMDVQLYREAAGQIGDPTVPRENKLAALETIEKLQGKYIENMTGINADQKPTQATPKAAPKRVKVDAQGNVIGN